MPCRPIPLVIFLLPLLACCAHKPPANLGISDAALVPAAMIRPPCEPPAALMAPPGPLAALPDALSQQGALQAWLADMQAYQQLRGQAGALQTFIRASCQ